MQRLIIGVLLAAGRSQRMGRLKQLMPWPNEHDATEKPMVAAAFDAVSAICDRMFVVTGTQASAVCEALRPREFHEAPGSGEAEMIVSVRAGLAAAAHLDDTADVLLHLADHPQVKPATLEDIVDARARFPDAVIIPEYEGRGGHPILIPPMVVDELIKSEKSFPGGLAAFWKSRADICCRIATGDPFVIRDFDTPEDL